MHLEEEVKLTAPDRSALDAVLQDPGVLAVAGRHSVQDRSFLATYYDTPEKELLRRKLGFRMRQVGDQWWIGLKGSGSLVAGVSRHLEWEVRSTKPVVRFWDLPPGPLRDQVLSIVRADSPVTPLLTTDIHRRTLELDLAEGCRAEMALDAGIIRAGGKKIPLFEVELESLAGPFAPILAFATDLTRRHDLVPATLTKFHQGVALLGIN
ncbi:MAG: CYTH domain-containing protein [Magnetococcales bacterium]|nr:CYTH domain-containing protein [Magnetococcales bacterium]MBF0322847.1 CYTH domain-containing protein [Magnetococcales bacterium]